jgi:hypothetical protein
MKTIIEESEYSIVFNPSDNKLIFTGQFFNISKKNQSTFSRFLTEMLQTKKSKTVIDMHQSSFMDFKMLAYLYQFLTSLDKKEWGSIELIGYDSYAWQGQFMLNASSLCPKINLRYNDFHANPDNLSL